MIIYSSSSGVFFRFWVKANLYDNHLRRAENTNEEAIEKMPLVGRVSTR